MTTYTREQTKLERAYNARINQQLQEQQARANAERKQGIFGKVETLQERRMTNWYVTKTNR